jgi:hypothetical protein
MPRPARFKQNDLVRALKAVKAAGENPKRIDVDPAGNIRVFLGASQQNETTFDNPWDEVLT